MARLGRRIAPLPRFLRRFVLTARDRVYTRLIETRPDLGRPERNKKGARMAIDGTWALTIETPIGTQELTLEAQASGGALNGSQTGPDGSQPIQDGAVNGDEATWSVNITSPMPMTLEFKGTVQGDTMTGSVKLGMFGELTFSAVRA